MKHLNTSKVYDKLDSIENKIETQNVQIIDINGAVNFLKLKKSYIYLLIHKRKIPFYKPGRKVYFDKIELQNWILNSKVKTQIEIEEEYKKKKNKSLFLTSN